MRDGFVNRFGEVVAREFDRRTFLTIVGRSVFAGTAVFAVSAVMPRGVLAYNCANVETGTTACNPTNGVYCQNWDVTFCSGSSCAGGCSFQGLGDGSWNDGCWCTDDFCTGSSFGHWECCDCNCPHNPAGCSCHRWVQVQSGCPQGPVGATASRAAA